MFRRKIRDGERPLCPECGTPLVWSLTTVCNGGYEVYSWFYNCDCIDESLLLADVIDEM